MDSGFTNPLAPTQASIMRNVTYSNISGTTTEPSSDTSGFRVAAILSSPGSGTYAPTDYSQSKAAGTATVTGTPSFAGLSFYDPSGFTISTLGSGTLNQGVTASLNANTSIIATPEPATLAMAMSGLPAVGLTLLRRRKATA